MLPPDEARIGFTATPGRVAGFGHIFVRDRATGGVQCLSVTPDDQRGDNDSTRPAISPNGCYVAFESLARNLAVGCSSGIQQILVRDLQLNATTCVSVGPDGRPGDAPSGQPALNDTGRVVAFQLSAGNLAVGCSNGAPQIIVRNLDTGATGKQGFRSARRGRRAEPDRTLRRVAELGCGRATATRWRPQGDAAASGWRRTCCRRSSLGCSRRIPGGSAGTARFGSGAGCRQRDRRGTLSARLVRALMSPAQASGMPCSGGSLMARVVW